MLVTQMDVFNRLLGTVQINLRSSAWALVPAVALLVLWEARQAHRPALSGPGWKPFRYHTTR